MNPAHPDQTLFKRILFCTDFSENAHFAFEFAIDSARRRPGCTLFLLHVVPEADAQFWNTYLAEVEDVEDKQRRDIQEKIDVDYRARLPEGVAMEVVVLPGKEAPTILEFARGHDVDCIILGRQGHGGLGTMLFGNVTEAVAGKADCAVLIIPLSFARKAEAE